MTDLKEVKNWDLGKKLGAGLCGVVVHGTKQNDEEKKSAIKIVDLKILEKTFENYGVTLPELVENLKKEIKIMGMIDHRNVVRLYDSFTLDNNVFMCMELVEGKDLLSTIPGGGLPLSIARDFFFQLCSALAYCHGNKIIHGDMKPENVLVRSDNRIKVIDFGFSHIVDGQPLSVMGGTLLYSPPCDDDMTYGWDDWAAGVILYAMVCCSLPFTEGALTSNDDLDLNVPQKIPPEVVEILSLLLNPDLDTRASVGDIILQSKWLEVEREKGIPESVSRVLTAPKPARPAKPQTVRRLTSVNRRPSNEPLMRTQKRVFNPLKNLWRKRDKSLSNTLVPPRTEEGGGGERRKRRKSVGNAWKGIKIDPADSDRGKGGSDISQSGGRSMSEAHNLEESGSTSSLVDSIRGFVKSPARVPRSPPKREREAPKSPPAEEPKSPEKKKKEKKKGKKKRREGDLYDPEARLHDLPGKEDVSSPETDTDSSQQSPSCAALSLPNPALPLIQVVIFSEHRYIQSLAELLQLRVRLPEVEAIKIIPPVVDKILSFHRKFAERISHNADAISNAKFILDSFKSDDFKEIYQEYFSLYPSCVRYLNFVFLKDRDVKMSILEQNNILNHLSLPLKRPMECVSFLSMLHEETAVKEELARGSVRSAMVEMMALNSKCQENIMASYVAKRQ